MQCCLHLASVSYVLYEHSSILYCHENAKTHALSSARNKCCDTLPVLSKSLVHSRLRIFLIEQNLRFVNMRRARTHWRLDVQSARMQVIIFFSLPVHSHPLLTQKNTTTLDASRRHAPMLAEKMFFHFDPKHPHLFFATRRRDIWQCGRHALREASCQMEAEPRAFIFVFPTCSPKLPEAAGSPIPCSDSPCTVMSNATRPVAVPDRAGPPQHVFAEHHASSIPLLSTSPNRAVLKLSPPVQNDAPINSTFIE